MLYLKKLKTISKYKKINLCLLFLCIILTLFRLSIPEKSSFTEGDNSLTGTIEKVYQKEGKTILEIRINRKEKIRGIFKGKGESTFFEQDIVNISGTLEEIRGNQNFYLFSYPKYAQRNGFFFQMNIDTIQKIKSSQNIFVKMKKIIREKIDKHPSKIYLFAFILGDKNEIPKEVYESYQENGVAHLFAISGMHISFWVNILTLCLKKTKIKERTKVILIFTLLVFYSFLASFSISVLRACLCYLLRKIEKRYHPEEPCIFSVLQVFILLLFIFPHNLFALAFQYSFAISFVLTFQRDKLKRKKVKLNRLELSLLIFIVSLPITIFHFHQVNILSILYNLFFIPYVSVLLFPLSFVVLLLSQFAPLYEKMTQVLEGASLFCHQIKFGKLTMPHPSLVWLTGIILIGIFCILLLIERKKSYLLLLCGFLLFYTNLNFIRKETYVTTLDVGQGDATLINIQSQTILIDTGGSISYDYAKNVIIPYLNASGIKSIETLILSHGDFDHMGSAISLVNDFKVKKVIFNCGKFNELEQDLIKVLAKKKIPYYSCIKELKIEKNKLYFLNNKDYGNENDNSSVIYTELNNHKFLFMGDAGIEVEEDLIEKYNLQDIDVLKVGHHGSKTSSSKSFINEINPKYAVISVGKNNRYGHPNGNVLDNLGDSKIYRTDKDGSIMFRIKNNKLKIETCLPRKE